MAGDELRAGLPGAGVFRTENMDARANGRQAVCKWTLRSRQGRSYTCLRLRDPVRHKTDDAEPTILPQIK